MLSLPSKSVVVRAARRFWPAAANRLPSFNLAEKLVKNCDHWPPDGSAF
jgi:hypothetical protein